MANQRRRPKPARTDTRRRVARTARLSETLREVIADELAKIDDDRLGFVTITSVDVDSEMNRGIVFYDSMQGAEGDELILEALNDHRKRLQSVIADQVRARRTPVLQFRPDDAIRAAQRIDEVLRQDEIRRQELFGDKKTES
ncbi:MAG: 30S ribosome-binding factor RbfA [Actinobacteria bacterium]|jgi:ribosome-binding factor A|nr:30S ribosome-binding factor RbfA [Actinomycetota bacterium]NDA38073.1 30S ribosome-binding factor RbfA [Acidimicrobiia bacterium]NBP42216.1 30S ribosome-binding factor RbfA [Actinomycetota bacterium]NBQ04210.1 30S ribosome-binding factor RbfA [Actinomycetota bacterium]NDE70560.1 30S ribosome-binding factor RbfA [Actinomycetota bacterium]